MKTLDIGMSYFKIEIGWKRWYDLWYPGSFSETLVQLMKDKKLSAVLHRIIGGNQRAAFFARGNNERSLRKSRYNSVPYRKKIGLWRNLRRVLGYKQSALLHCFYKSVVICGIAIIEAVRKHGNNPSAFQRALYRGAVRAVRHTRHHGEMPS